MVAGRNPGGIYMKLDTGDRITLITAFMTLAIWFIFKGRKYV